MRLSIQHHTTYRYENPAEYAAQILRLTPRPYDGLSILSWRVTTRGPGRLSSFEDGFGNASHVHTVAYVHDTVEVRVEGLVETSDTQGIVRGGNEPLPLGAFLRETSLTFPSDGIRELAAEAAKASTTAERLRRLCGLVRARIDYRQGQTAVTTTAADALAGGSGVCQDHAHVFIAAARALGIPARYVGGYLCMDGDAASVGSVEMNVTDPTQQEAGHAWAEAFDDVRGWTGFDPANDQVVGARHVRTSVGLDYGSAAPVRGVRRDRGGVRGAETLEVNVHVSRLVEQ